MTWPSAVVAAAHIELKRQQQSQSGKGVKVGENGGEKAATCSKVQYKFRLQMLPSADATDLTRFTRQIASLHIQKVAVRFGENRWKSLQRGAGCAHGSVGRLRRAHKLIFQH